jgi:hypothetical protein
LYGETDVYATTYLPLVWESDAFVVDYQGGTLTLEQTIAGGGVLIEFSIDGGSYATWPGATAVNKDQEIVWRVSIAGGATQGVISVFEASLVMPDVRQTFNDISIDSGGTRLTPSSGTPARTWISIKSVQITPIVDGSGSIGGRVTDFNTSTGPLVQLVNTSGTAVTGRATVEISGLADG